MYAFLFFFETSNFEIGTCYQPPAEQHDSDRSIQPGESLTISYGSDRNLSWGYLLKDDQDVDVGFFKLFLSTEEVDLTGIPQASPFESRPKYRGKKPEIQHPNFWHTTLFTVVQRRHPVV